MTRPRMAGIDPSCRVVMVADRKAMPVAPAQHAAKAAVTGLGEMAMNAVAMPKAMLVRARNRVVIIWRRAIHNEPVSDPMLNTVVMNAYVLVVPWKVRTASNGRRTFQLNDRVATTPISIIASRSSGSVHT